MKVYFGVRNPEGCKVFWWDTASPDRPNPLPLAQELWNHSPEGPEWGYAGNGAAQLAVALLWHCTRDAYFAQEMHQTVKDHLVAKLPHEVWARTELEILECACDEAPTDALKMEAVKWYNGLATANRKKGGTTNG